MDVRSLYTNIPHKEGTEAVEATLKRKNNPTKVIITFLKLILTVKTIYKSKDVLWELNTHIPTPIFFWECSKLSTTLFKKETDFQAYVHRKSEHSESLKRSIPYTQALRVK